MGALSEYEDIAASSCAAMGLLAHDEYKPRPNRKRGPRRQDRYDKVDGRPISRRFGRRRRSPDARWRRSAERSTVSTGYVLRN